MPWVYRDVSGDIVGYSKWNNDPAQDFLDEDSVEWLAYLEILEHNKLMTELSANHYMALDSLTYDFGDGRVIQTRPRDEQNMKISIEKGVSRDWVMVDNVPHTVTVAELQTAYDHGKVEAIALWDSFTSELKIILGV